ncbi:PAS domain-containing protein [bacterium]|nr:PAS domain-containing protein [bacterium]
MGKTLIIIKQKQMTSIFTNRKMFIIATCMFLITMSSVLFLVGEDKISVDIDNHDLQTFMLQSDQLKTKHDESFYRDLIENQTDDFAIVNSNRNIKFITPHLEEVHGIQLTDDKDLNALTLIHPKDLTEFANTLMDYNKNPQIRSSIGPIRIRTKAGNYISYVLTLIPIFDENNEKIASAIILKDISKPLGEQNSDE